MHLFTYRERLLRESPLREFYPAGRLLPADHPQFFRAGHSAGFPARAAAAGLHVRRGSDSGSVSCCITSADRIPAAERIILYVYFDIENVRYLYPQTVAFFFCLCYNDNKFVRGNS